MKIGKCILILALFSLIISGCKDQSSYVGAKREANSYSEKLITLSQPLNLKLDCDSGSIEVYSWHEDLSLIHISEPTRPY